MIGGLLAGGLAYDRSSSVLPGSYGMSASTTMDYGGGPSDATAGMSIGAGPGSVARLTGNDTSGPPDARFTLTAQQSTIRLSSGTLVEAWTYNGQIPGPQLRCARVTWSRSP
ncbi:MAG: hypothetical protein M3Z25_12775 [Actinomycetota bacterium]|nr:hypothetical protein [Actinomycetota bacterium]